MYVKTKITDNVEIKVDLYDGEIFISCPVCGKELEVERDDFKQIMDSNGGFGSFIKICESCSQARRALFEKGRLY